MKQDTLIDEYVHECPICGTYCWLKEEAEVHCKVNKPIDYIKKESIHVPIEDNRGKYYRSRRPHINITSEQFFKREGS
ncbi:MAG: hypothetical protein ACP5OA_03390 [Candidatus Woesearchaeota archaeon]